MKPNNREYQELLRQIEQQVALRESTIMLAGEHYRWWQVADPDAVLQLAAEGVSAASMCQTTAKEISSSGCLAEMQAAVQDPFWAASWRSSVGLDRYLHQFDLCGKSVLELGCGCGAGGTSAAMRGAQVTMTDAVERALQIARLNSWDWRSKIRYRRLVWGVDWLEPRSFSMIIGSDIAYDPQLHAAIETCARFHLATTGTLCISEPGRRSGDRFAKYLQSNGWRIQLDQLDIEDGRSPIRIMNCELPER